MLRTPSDSVPEDAPQRQDSLTDQMRDVIRAAGRMGCYDAQDWLCRHFDMPGSDSRA